MGNWSIVVKQTGRTFAEDARDRWEHECMQGEVEQAERAAGWDPNP